MVKKIIMAGFANNKMSHGEVFRRYIDCFNYFSKPDIFDLQPFLQNDEFLIEKYPQYKGPQNHDIKYFHTTFNVYKGIKQKTNHIPRNKNVKKIGYFVWESSELYKEDQNVIKDFDEIWTASAYCKNIFSQYIDESQIKIIPHPINIPNNNIKKFKKFTILIIGNISSSLDRKNIHANIKVANLLKNKYKDIDIVFKTFSGSDKERHILKTITKNLPIKIIDEYYSSQDIQTLISKSHVILSLHCSEGFGLTLAEALVSDTIPISTGYSGNLDFILNKNLLVNYKMSDTNIDYYKGEWGSPDIDDAFEKLEFIYINYKKGLQFIQESKEQLIKNNNKFQISHEIKKHLYSDIDWAKKYTDLLVHPCSINIEQPGGFLNPAAIIEKDSIFLLSRTENISDVHKTSVLENKSNPVLFELDKEFNIKNYNQIQSVNSTHLTKKIEDFRSFKHNNKTFISCTSIENNKITPQIWEFNIKSKKFKKSYNPTLVDFNINHVEKNWSYFTNKGKLYLIYSASPYILFEDTGNFKFKKILQNNINTFWKNNHFIANSINPFEFGNYWFHIVHINTGNKNYYHYPLLINRQTLLPELYTNEPIFRKENCYGTYNNVLYLTDYIREKSKIHFFFGEGDLCITKKTMNIQELEKLNWKTI